MSESDRNCDGTVRPGCAVKRLGPPKRKPLSTSAYAMKSLLGIQVTEPLGKKPLCFCEPATSLVREPGGVRGKKPEEVVSVASSVLKARPPKVIFQASLKCQVASPKSALSSPVTGICAFKTLSPGAASSPMPAPNTGP